jgi:hypothetical protein
LAGKSAAPERSGAAFFALVERFGADPGEPLECALVRSDQEPVVVNLDIEPVERPETVPWIDPIHRHPQD